MTAAHERGSPPPHTKPHTPRPSGWHRQGQSPTPSALGRHPLAAPGRTAQPASPKFLPKEGTAPAGSLPPAEAPPLPFLSVSTWRLPVRSPGEPRLAACCPEVPAPRCPSSPLFPSFFITACWPLQAICLDFPGRGGSRLRLRFPCFCFSPNRHFPNGNLRGARRRHCPRLCLFLPACLLSPAR